MGAKVFCRLLLMTVIGTSLANGAETNSMPQFARLFIFPEPHLRAERTALPASASVPTVSVPREIRLSSLRAETKAAAPETLPVDHVFLRTDLLGLGSQSYHHYPPDFGIIRPVRSSDDPLVRCLDSVFRPEEFRVGKTTVSCSILTAIKRKNPLCLINPIFLNVSW
jgi:hypothetical protein